MAIPPLPPLNGPGTQASASAKGSLSAELATGGPVRSGYILLSENIVLTNGPGAPVVGTADVTIGSLSTTCSAVNSPLPGANCTGSLAAANGHIFPFVQLPFTLGQAFLLSEDVSLFASLQSSQLSIDGDSTGTGMLSVGFSFTDLNGAPVQAYAVPEPKSWALLLAGSFVLAGWSFARLSQKVRRM
ncbi:MAG: hypothetical protein JO051_06155 [Acidobacteriaceae bacterium]|nr:hypothetical protein [Acidobacteriaceae bacterium]